MNKTKTISLLGATGSIGLATCEIIRQYPQDFSLVAIAAHSNIEALAAIAREFSPQVIAIADTSQYAALKKILPNTTAEIIAGPQAIIACAEYSAADIVVQAMVGAAGLEPTLQALKAQKTVALANKESLVIGGSLMAAHSSFENQLIPIDSEHSAIFQCLQGHEKNHVKNIWLTASGGPFLHWDRIQLHHVTPQQALNHPTWEMGKRITIDSATFINKAFEIIEAHWLFKLDTSKIQVVIHPQSIIHSMVEFQDGNILAQLGHHNMQLPIGYALSYPKRLLRSQQEQQLSITQFGQMHFYPLEPIHHESLTLAYDCLAAGKTFPAVFNAADEIAVEKFLQGRLAFLNIVPVISEVLAKHNAPQSITLEAIQEADRWSREKTNAVIANHT